MDDVIGTVGNYIRALPQFFYQNALTVYGIVLLALVPAGILWLWVDRRTVNGESVAIKPTKFLLSIGIHVLTLSWMFGFVQLRRLQTFAPQATVWIVLVSSTWEIACIILQATKAKMSHFNRSTPIDSAIFVSMGIFAALLVLGNLPLAWEIATRPAEDANATMTTAVVAGLLVSCIIGGGTGIFMGARNSHAVGRENKTLPLFGWSATAGDFRPAHFLSIHALQAFPAMAVVSSMLSFTNAGTIFTVAAIGYCILIDATFIQALKGQPLICGGLSR